MHLLLRCSQGSSIVPRNPFPPLQVMCTFAMRPCARRRGYRSFNTELKLLQQCEFHCILRALTVRPSNHPTMANHVLCAERDITNPPTSPERRVCEMVASSLFFSVRKSSSQSNLQTSIQKSTDLSRASSVWDFEARSLLLSAHYHSSKQPAISTTHYYQPSKNQASMLSTICRHPS